MKRYREKLLGRLKAVAVVAAVAVFAAAAIVLAPQRARADEVEFSTTPIPQIEDWVDGNSFVWVDEVSDMPAHYEIRLGDDDGDHDSLDGWWRFAQASREHTFSSYLVVLVDDLDFTNLDWNRVGGDRQAYTVGSEDMPFAGVFDGGGHTISNLTNDREFPYAVADCGFFGWTNDATIKNINFDNCYVGGSFRSGLVVGCAVDTFLLNILCTNCTSSVIPGNNVINLITNAGMVGGMIAGETNGSTLYNCEMRGGTVVTNATQGLAALGGQPLYLGGLVGSAQDSVIEYSRVTDIEKEDGSFTPAHIKNQYSTAVSVANFSELFTGSIAGAINAQDTGTRIVDCYSTADVYSEAAIYFGVGLGLGVTRGYTGGIVGIVQEGSETGLDANELNGIERVSFAGNLHSYNYNIILLGIPAIEYDKYMGAITGRGGANASIHDAYFKRYAADGSIFGSTTDEDIYAYKTTYGGGEMDGGDFGARDAYYTNRTWWEGQDFDFAGGKLRNEGDYYQFTDAVADSEWSYNHYNKWVMDYDRGIPVHGGSVKATMDFPGSGTVTIGDTSLAEDASQATTNPYDFAVQGYEVAKDEQIDITYDLEQNTDSANASWAADGKNQGFRYMGWYLNRETRVNDIAEDHSLFTEPNSTLNAAANGDEAVIHESHATGDEPENDGLNESYTLSPQAPVDMTAPGEGEYSDNDLYVAYAQANVLLHNAAGTAVHHDEQGAIVAEGAEGVSDDWYDYQESFVLPTEVPGDKKDDGGSISDTATLIGWTTDKDYTGVLTSAQLDQAKADGAYFEVGSTYVVDRPVNLYPVYSDYITNINVIYEGHENDLADEDTYEDGDDYKKRDNYGQVAVADEDGRYYIEMTRVMDEGKNPLIDGVEFIGWYEQLDPDDPDSEVRVSSDERFYLDDVDLTREHTYTARFKYRVRYYDEADGDLYATLWVRYDEHFTNYDAPQVPDSAVDNEGLFEQWFTGKNHDGITNDLGAVRHEDASNWYLKYPFDVHAHWEDVEDPYDQEMIFSTDFPGGATQDYEVDGGISGVDTDWLVTTVTATATENQGYNLYGWTTEGTAGEWVHGIADGENAGDDERDIMPEEGSVGFESRSWGTNRFYFHQTRLTADVTFHMPDENTVVERRYQENVFLDADVQHAGVQTDQDPYNYGFRLDANVGKDSGLSSTSVKAPTAQDMSDKGYIFLGWINRADLSEYEFNNYVFTGEDLGNDVKAVSDVTRALPYVVDEDALLCYGPMDLYPVYAKFDVTTTTNIAEAGVVEGAGINIPENPVITGVTGDGLVEHTLQYNGDQQATIHYNPADGTATITLTADLDTPVTAEDPEALYELVSFEVRYADGTVQTIQPDQDADGNPVAGAYTFKIRAGMSYTFVANYDPIAVVYHVAPPTADDGGISVVLRNHGALLGSAPVTSTEVDEAYGMTDQLGFFCGWTEEEPVDGEAYVRYHDDVKLVSASTRVEGALELWPVYREANITVKSNIDDTVDTSHRYAERSGEDIALVAEAVEGYQFERWEQVTADGNVPCGTRVTGDDRFAGNTYEAIYTKVYEVRYYDTDGNVIYTATVPEDDPRTFYQTIEDAEGNPVESIIDYQAFVAINEALSSSEPDESGAIERFSTWQLDNGDGTYERWANDQSNFTHQSITRDMDLYPVTVAFTANDAEKQPYAGQLDWSVAVEEDGGTSASIRFKGDYTQSRLTVRAQEKTYGPDGATASDSSPLEGAPVTLFMKDGMKYDTQTTDETGTCVFTFEGLLSITKTSSESRAAGEVFSFIVAPKDNLAEARRMTIQLPETSNNDGVYSTTRCLALPYGEYTVAEDTDWAWRYDATARVYDFDGGSWVNLEDGRFVSVTYAGGTVGGDGTMTSANPVQVLFTNTLDQDLGNKWMDGSDYEHNVFDGKGSE